MTVHVVGCGLAGLACALRLAEAGVPLALHEASGQAGGRCRSWHDRGLDARLDNGAHVLVGANRAALGYLARIGSPQRLRDVGPLPFVDLRDGKRWRLPPGPLGPLAVPGVGRGALGAALRLALAGDDATVEQRLGGDRLAFERLWRPLALAILNTPPAAASARLLGTALRKALLGGRGSGRVYLPQGGLGGAFVDPALALLARRGVVPAWHRRLAGIEEESGRAGTLRFADGRHALAAPDSVVLALPWHAAAGLLPWLEAPRGAHAIVNVHYRLPGPVRLAGGAPLLGLIGATAQWLFARERWLTVTVSAADALLGQPAEAIAGGLWREVAPLCGGDARVPPARVVKERRATFAQTPPELRRRPGPATRLGNLFFAGDWTATGLPATIEGAIVSGERAAAALLATANSSRSAGFKSARSRLI